MAEVKGIDTIQNLVGQPPIDIELDKELVAKQQGLLAQWNSKYIAILPYCYRCRQPLIWFIPPEDGKMFLCPGCGREWTMKEKEL